MPAVSIYQGLVNRGITADLPAHERKRILIINRVWIVLDGLGFASAIIVFAIYLYLLQVDPVRYHNYYWYPVYILGYMLFNASGFFMKDLPRIGYAVTLFHFNCIQLFVVGLAVLGGQELGIEVLLYLFFLLPHYVFAHSRGKTIVWATLSNFGCIIFVRWFFNHGEPLLPIRDTPVADALPLVAMAISGLSFVGVAYYLVSETARAETLVQVEKEKSERLLLNILPKKVADELKEHGSSTPVHYNSVTVLFTDFVGFTKIAENLSPGQLIDELDACFSKFDSITRQHGLEKIKTIGDSYMVAGGLPDKNGRHPFDVCLAALQMRDYMEELKAARQKQGQPYWEVRIGVHTGPLVAGVIGEMKFAYDVFGDTVNTASRLETGGVAGQVNISASTYALVSQVFLCEHRGKIAAKNKGPLDMYFVHGLKPDYKDQHNPAIQVPNRKYEELLGTLGATRG